jgi:HAD superfamily hydrolase (TIGR01509 family)
MYQAILFDMDGVLIETRQSVTRFWMQMAQNHNIELTTSDFDQNIYGCPAQHTLDVLFGHLSGADHRAVLDHLAQSEPTWPFNAIPGVISFLHSLHQLQIPAALVTSAYRKRVTQVLDGLNLQKLLPVTVSKDQILHGKPHPEGYLTAAKRLDVSPEQCVVFEDSLSGATAGIRAGALCIGVQSGALAAPLRQIGARHVISDFCRVQMVCQPNESCFLNIDGIQVQFDHP